MKRRSQALAVGRPRAFDPDQALEAAMQVFWKKGYEGASIEDLTQAMGINRPSMYATFGDKEALFRKVLDRYDQGPVAFVSAALEEKTARAVARKILSGTVALLSCPKNPHGCLMVQGALAAGDSARAACGELLSRRESGVALLRKRFRRARAEGDLPRSADPAALARFLATVMHGMSVQAASGATRKELQRVMALAMQAWPQ